jgi:hypothetical protein
VFGSPVVKPEVQFYKNVGFFEPPFVLKLIHKIIFDQIFSALSWVLEGKYAVWHVLWHKYGNMVCKIILNQK